MSGYNSANTKVLATHEQAGGNRRMLLIHECESGRHEYVIGSYFTEQREEAPEPRIAIRLDNEAKSFAPAMRGYGTRNLLEDLADEVRRAQPSEIVHYSWDWGHYFGDVVSAVDYWKREVLNDGEPRYSENECPHCGGYDDWGDIEQEDPHNGEWAMWARCPKCNGLHKLVWKLAENIPVEG